MLKYFGDWSLPSLSSASAGVLAFAPTKARHVSRAVGRRASRRRRGEDSFLSSTTCAAPRSGRPTRKRPRDDEF
jgi:hypothetical protein